MKGSFNLNKVKIHFTVVFHAGCNVNINKAMLDKFDVNGYEDADVEAHIVEEKHNTAITFAAQGYFSDCSDAARNFLIKLIQDVKTENTYEYTIVHDFLYPFINILNTEIQYQSFHKISRNTIYANAGLEIESYNDGRLSDTIHVLEDNDHYGINFKQCPNCRDFEIPDSKNLAQHIKRCPSCGLKLTPY